MSRPPVPSPAARTSAPDLHRRRTAVHEAGHAFVAYLVGIRFRHVSIREVGDSSGRVVLLFAQGRFPRADWQRARLLSLAHLVVLASGAAAEEVHLGEACWPGIVADFRDMRRVARRCARLAGNGGPTARPIAREAFRLAHAFLASNLGQVAVCAVSTALLKCSILSERQVALIIESPIGRDETRRATLPLRGALIRLDATISKTARSEVSRPESRAAPKARVA